MASIIFGIITSTGWVGYFERMANKNKHRTEGPPRMSAGEFEDGLVVSNWLGVRTCDEPLDPYSPGIYYCLSNYQLFSKDSALSTKWTCEAASNKDPKHSIRAETFHSS